MKVSRILTLLALLFSSVFAGNYGVDISHSSVGFKVKHLMISNVNGNFGLFDGVVEYDKASNKVLFIQGEVDAESVNTENEKRDDHLRSPDFFDVAKYGSIVFKSTKIEGDTVYADFTIKGITKNVKFELEDLGSVVDPWGNHRVGFTLSSKIDRADFGLTWNKALETGGLLVGNEVKITAEIQAIEKK